MNRKSVLAAAGSLVLVSGVIVQSSSAAFSGSTENAGNSWAAGTVTLTDNDAGVAMFNESGLVPGNGGQRCIVVTYGGTLAADVRHYASITGGTGLGTWLDMNVQAGTGAQADCSDFTSSQNVYSGTLAGLAGTHTNFASGAGTWAPTGPGQTRTYRFAWELQDTNSAQGLSVQAQFTWEARNS
jgi:hypothetical protein